MNITQLLDAAGFTGVSTELVVFLLVWSLFWKGLALWHSAKRGAPFWFIILLIVNTIGILEIVYLFLVCKLRPADLIKK